MTRIEEMFDRVVKRMMESGVTKVDFGERTDWPAPDRGGSGLADYLVLLSGEETARGFKQYDLSFLYLMDLGEGKHALMARTNLGTINLLDEVPNEDDWWDIEDMVAGACEDYDNEEF